MPSVYIINLIWQLL